MHETTTRERIMKRIRNAGLVQVENKYMHINQDSDVYATTEENEDLLVRFAQELNNIGGSFVFCESVALLQQNLKILMASRKITELFSIDTQLSKLLAEGGIPMTSDMKKITTAPLILTGCEALVARLGTVVISSKQESGRMANFLPESHVVVAEQSQVVSTVKDAMNHLKEKYSELPSMVSFITGPSRTADIEKTLVMGAHGPRELIVFVVESLSQ